MFIRVPQSSLSSSKPFETQYSLSSKGPWSPISISRKIPAWDETTFVVQVAGLKNKVQYLRVTQGDLRTKGVKIDLPVEERSGTMRKLLSSDSEEEEEEKTEKGMRSLDFRLLDA